MKTYLRAKIIGSLPASKTLDPILRNMCGPERRGRTLMVLDGGQTRSLGGVCGMSDLNLMASLIAAALRIWAQKQKSCWSIIARDHSIASV